LSKAFIDKLDLEIQNHELVDQNHLIDWPMVKQFSKDKKTTALMESWEKSPSILKRRVFWYYKARLRWMGNTNHPNTEYLLIVIEANMCNEQPKIQWTMNYTVGQIGKWQEEYRAKCIPIGKKTGLYND
jgi:hypothetical protein